MTLRKATPSDAAALAAIERECFASETWTGADFLQYETNVAEFEGKLVGFGVRHRLVDDEFEILNLAVLPGFRRTGIARQLLKQLMADPGTYYLEVRESNLAALTLYEQFGFHEVGRRPNYYHSPEETAIVMRVNQC